MVQHGGDLQRRVFVALLQHALGHLHQHDRRVDALQAAAHLPNALNGNELDPVLVLECLHFLPRLQPKRLADVPRNDDLELGETVTIVMGTSSIGVVCERPRRSRDARTRARGSVAGLLLGGAQVELLRLGIGQAKVHAAADLDIQNTVPGGSGPPSGEDGGDDVLRDEHIGGDDGGPIGVVPAEPGDR